MDIKDIKRDTMRLNPAHVTEFPNGFILDNRYIQEIYNTKPSTDIYHVSPDFETDSDNFKFSKIMDAMTYAKANKPEYPREVAIMVYPGVYEEQITDAHYRIYLVGVVPTSYYMKSAILYNTGVDAAHHPIAYSGGSTLNMINMTVLVDDGGCYGELPNARFDNCSFRTGYFTERSDTSACSVEFRHCMIKGNAFDFTGETGGRFLAFRNCDIYDGTLNFGSTSPVDTDKSIKFERCMMNSDVGIKGNWSINAYLAELYGSGIVTFDTTGSINIDKVLIPNGLHFISDPAGSKIISDCNFTNPDIASDHLDISADVIVTDVNYSGNDQQNGISGNIQITNSEKNVGGCARDGYFSLQDAITSVPANEKCSVKIWCDIIDLPEIVLTNDNINVHINGQKKYGLTFTGDIVEIGAGKIFGFSDMGTVIGGNIQVNGAGAELSFESCQYINGYVTITSGSFIIVYKTSLFGSTGHKAIQIDNADSMVVVGYSRVQGSVGNEAVNFSVAAVNKFKAKYSSFIHGDKSTDYPLIYTGTGKVDISMYNCGLNAAWDSSKVYNLIGAANNTTDTEINF